MSKMTLKTEGDTHPNGFCSSNSVILIDAPYNRLLRKRPVGTALMP